ncbi:hypothetical protein [Saccharomonospora iraqiensis]|uniref:hypothetical protein n=1 Tax=Saccharomonospora iraqiensis TaxID=52698 RepID=UPI00022DF116|nr:hypothetical protein [Saccharomonospora iraqiensis]
MRETASSNFGAADDRESRRHWFREHTASWVRAMNTDDEGPDEADGITDRMDALVRAWDQEGVTGEILRPLLTDGSAHVRVAAAAYLLQRGETAPAFDVLQAAADDDAQVLAASAADSVLLVRRRQQSR